MFCHLRHKSRPRAKVFNTLANRFAAKCQMIEVLVDDIKLRRTVVSRFAELPQPDFAGIQRIRRSRGGKRNRWTSCMVECLNINIILFKISRCLPAIVFRTPKDFQQLWRRIVVAAVANSVARPRKREATVLQPIQRVSNGR